MDEEKNDAGEWISGLHYRYVLDYDKFISKVESKSIMWEEFYSIEEIKQLWPNNAILEEEEEDEDEPLEGEMMDPPEVGPIVNEPISGWLDAQIESDLRSRRIVKDVLNNSTKGLPVTVREDIQKNSTQILSRCTNPHEWDMNRQGLVFGMVQSGKTMSMVNVASQAFASGYRIVIMFAGDKNSLRSQSQDRFDDAFSMHVNNQTYGLWSPTSIDDITKIQNVNHNNFFNTTLIRRRTAKEKDWGVVIIMKKQKHQLEKLLELWGDFETWVKNTPAIMNHIEVQDGEVHIPTLIFDDESHYASIDTRPDSDDIATIHDLIEQITLKIKWNNYIGYTATPQSVIAAYEGKYNYPSDFIWLLEPDYLDDKRTITSSYLGGNEFFHVHSNQLLHELSEEVWPHNQKEWNGRNIKGIYYPGISPQKGVFDEDINLKDAESDFITEILSSSNPRQLPNDFVRAILEFIVGGGIRWYLHYVKHHQDKPFDEISNSFIQDKREEEEFPFHAIMFNLSRITDNQSGVAQVIQEVALKKVKELWGSYLNGNKEDLVSLVLREYFSRAPITDGVKKKVYFFIQKCLEISVKTILTSNHGGCVYLVNSENDKLNYSKEYRSNERVKKAAIIVGGNILAMGLTVEGLCISFFTRTQNDSNMDTNLQMCRWFGHKRSYLYAVKLFTLGECARIYRDIADADAQLRRDVKRMIKLNYKPKQILLALRNSPFFNATSASKSYYLSAGEAETYTGKLCSLQTPSFLAKDIKINSQLTKEYIHQLDARHDNGELVHGDRAHIYKDVNKESFFSFLEEFICDVDAVSISSSSYLEYLKIWDNWKGVNQLPKINIAVWNNDNTQRTRAFPRKLNSEVDDIAYVKKSHMPKFSSIVGGRSGSKNYIGDRYIDFDTRFHEDNKLTDTEELTKIGWETRKEILFIFYKMDPNYITKTKLIDHTGKLILEPTDERYIDIGNETFFTFVAVTPVNGPMWNCSDNSSIVDPISMFDDLTDAENE